MRGLWRADLERCLSQVQAGYRSRRLTVIYGAGTGGRFRPLLRFLQQTGIVGHYEVRGCAAAARARLWLRYWHGRPAFAVWVCAAKHLRTRSLTVAEILRLTRLYPGLTLYLSTPQGWLSGDECIRRHIGGGALFGLRVY